MAQVQSLNVVFAEIPDVGGSVGRTSIDKRPVGDRRTVTSDGVFGDQRSDMKHHGAVTQAVYAYAQEDYDWWADELGRDFSAGVFGENLTTSDIDLNALVVGTKIRIGSVLLIATGPRIPCGTFARWLAEEQWVKKFTEANRAGSYFGVVTPGELGAGDELEIINVPEHGVSISEIYRVWNGDRDPRLLERVATCPDVLPEVRERARKFASQ
jgi:MOSC domain-containing protein YiiM